MRGLIIPSNEYHTGLIMRGYLMSLLDGLSPNRVLFWISNNVIEKARGCHPVTKESKEQKAKILTIPEILRNQQSLYPFLHAKISSMERN